MKYATPRFHDNVPTRTEAKNLPFSDTDLRSGGTIENQYVA